MTEWARTHARRFRREGEAPAEPLRSTIDEIRRLARRVALPIGRPQEEAKYVQAS
jgi:hypothetical protein